MNEKNPSDLLKIHLGCGKNALDGFLNFDNNIFLFLSLFHLLKIFLDFLILCQNGFVNSFQYQEKKILNIVMFQKKCLSRILQLILFIPAIC